MKRAWVGDDPMLKEEVEKMMEIKKVLKVVNEKRNKSAGDGTRIEKRDLMKDKLIELVREEEGALMEIEDGGDVVKAECWGEGKGNGMIILFRGRGFWIGECLKEKGKRMKEDYKRPTIRMEYINDSFSSLIRREIAKIGIDCNVSFKTVKMYDKMNSQTKRKKVKGLEEYEGVVYMFSCKRCGMEGKRNRYIGETGRMLGVRIKEHLRVSKKGEGYTEVSRHGLKDHGEVRKEDWDIQIIDRAETEFERKVKESCWIKKEKPELNVSEGLKVIGKEFIRLRGWTSPPEITDLQ